MIPLVLHLKNFLSYGPILQSISFEDHHLICLSGNNGHGKSALLESITWALWGQARRIHGVTKDDLSLIRIGETEMHVGFEFSIQNIRYLIKRSCLLKNKKIYSELVFGICDAQGIITKSLTENTQRETQEKINTIVGLDYETFINSVFLKQGQSNEFSKKNPKERKEILTKILGIHLLEKMRRHISEDLKDSLLRFQIHEQQKVILEKQMIPESDFSTWHKTLLSKKEIFQEEKKIHNQLKEQEQILQEKISQQIEKKSAILSEQLKKEYEIKELKKNICILYSSYATLKKIKKTIYKEDAFSANDFSPYLSFLQERRSEAEKSLNTYETLHSSLSERKEFLRSQHSQELFCLHHTLQENVLHISSTEKEYATACSRYKEKEQDIHNLTEKIQKLSVNIQTAENEIASQDNIVQNITRLRSLREKLLHQSSLLSSYQERSSSLITLCSDNNSAACPTCGSPFNVQQKEVLLASTKKKQILLQRIEERNKKWLKTIESLALACESRLLYLNKQEGEMRLDKERLLSAHQSLEECLAKKNSYKDLITEIEQSITILKHKKEETEKKYSELQLKEKVLYDNDQKCQEYVYILASYQGISQRYQKYEHFLSFFNRFIDEFKFQSFSSLKLFFKKSYNSLSSLKQTLSNTDLETHETLLSQIKKEYEHTTHQREALQEKLMQLHQHLAEEYAHYKTKHDQQQDIILALSTHSSAKQEIQKEIEMRQSLSSLISKDGLQAALVEQVIPEIEKEANILLEKLSDGQARISIDSIRDLKSGKTKETLDIVIADSLGTRPYEFFSGGEAFRIDLALRIALAKTLARRSGSVLQTLIIDEGFGSQDAGGLEAILHALQKIKEDFHKIIIVSHLPSFKEHFPTHFIVQKTVQGSVVKVYQQE